MLGENSVKVMPGSLPVPNPGLFKNWIGRENRGSQIFYKVSLSPSKFCLKYENLASASVP